MKHAAGFGLGLFALLTLAACGSTNEIAGDRDPVVSRDDAGGAGGAAAGGKSGDPDDAVSSDTGGKGGGTAAPPLPDTPACQKAFAQNDPGGKVCRATYRGACFESDPAACACAGCPADKCMILESYPTQIRCE